MSAQAVETAIPAVRFTPRELESGLLAPSRLEACADAFDSAGCLLLENLLPAGLVNRVRAEFVERYQGYLADRDHPDALNVGDRRYMVTVAVDGAFARPLLYAHPLLCALMVRWLGRGFVLGSFGAVVSLPGAEEQHIHRDHPPLFSREVDAKLPPFAVTAAIPLIDLNSMNGTTRMWPGSHRASDEETEAVVARDPFGPVGSCLLFDYRIRHCGTRNRSASPRPMLYNVYYRPWFRDAANYDRQAALIMSRASHEAVPDELKPLFAHASIE